MKPISRRKFIRGALTGLGALSLAPVLSACAPQPTAAPLSATKEINVQPSAQPTALPKPTDLPQPSATAAPSNTPRPQATPTIVSSPTAVIPPDLVVARGPDPEQLVRQAIKAMGGMEKFVKKGAKVVVKPNICVAYATVENAYTTNPFVVAAVVKLCLEAGASSVRVMDFPFNGTAANAYARSGIEAQVKAAGGEMVQMAGYRYVPYKIEQGKQLKNIGVYDEVLKADAFINIPIAKHHSLTGMTLAMKNLLGVIDDRMTIHINYGQRLADLSTLIKPTLNIVDAIRVLMDNGPASGSAKDVKKADTIVVTQDIVAADAYSTSFFGKKPDDLKNVVIGAEMKIGRKDLENLRIEEIAVGG